MGGFLRFVTRSRHHAIGVSALALLIPPFSFVAGAVIGLATLRYGMGEGALVLAGSALVFAAAMWGLAGSIAPAVLFVAVTGLPALALCALLRATSSQGYVLAVATLAAGASIVALYLAVADPVAWWTESIKTFLAARTGGDVDPQEFEEVAELLAPVLTGFPIAVMVTSTLVVFLARWSHAALDNPGGFGREFRALRLGRRFAAGSGVVVLVALFTTSREAGVGHDLVALLVAAYAIQGIALVHGLVSLRGGARGWVVAMYASLLLVTPITLLVLSVAGFSDAWIDYRARFDRSS